MATVAELAAREDPHVGWLFVIEGIPVAWTDTADLVGHGADTWIGSSADRPEILLGLELSDPINTGLDWEVDASGLPSDETLTITIVDHAGAVGTPPAHSMIKLIAEPSVRDFVQARIAPTDDPAPAIVIGEGGANVDVWGRWVNGESIGPAGERRRFPAFPDATLPGQDHAAVESPDQTFAPSVIADTPQIQKGLRCALYLIFGDKFSGAEGPDFWPDWSDQIDSGKSRVWWGTINEVTSSGPVFTVSCDGPAALLRKSLGASMPETWEQLTTRLHLVEDEGEREDLIGMGYKLMAALQGDGNKIAGFSLFDPVADKLTNDQNPGDLRAEIFARMQALASTAGPDGAFDSYDGEIIYDGAGIRIRKEDADIEPRAGWLSLCMHARVWQYLGWDPVAQNTPTDDIETTRDVYFIKCTNNKFVFYQGVASAPTPGEGYWIGNFTTLPPGVNLGTGGIAVDNAGGWRGYEPLNTPGTTTISHKGKQEIGLTFSVPPVYWTGQTARPPANHVMSGNGLACDRTGFIALRGQYRESLEDEAREIYQVAKVSWPDGGNMIADDLTGMGTVYLEKFLDPRRFGYRDAPITRPWTSDTIEWTPISVLGWNSHAMDKAHSVLLRIMLSSGTGSWDAGSYEDEDGATFTVGSNAHPDAVAPHLAADDQEIADLGLCIPAGMIDWRSFVDAANALPGGGYKSPLNTCKVAKHGSFASDEAMAGLMKPRGFYMGLDGFRYSLFNLGAPLDADDAAVTITEADIDSDGQPYIPDVSLSPFVGFDRLSIDYHFAATGEGGEPGKLEARPLSSRARVRAGNGEESMEGIGLCDPAAWAGVDNTKAPPDWQSSWRQLWQRDLAEYLLDSHELITGLPVKTPKALQLNPGTVVLYTGPWPATRTGSYGMINRVCRVLSVSRDVNSLTATVDLLVQAGDATRRRFAPIARVLDNVDTLEERIDADPDVRTLYCYGDAWGSEGASDVRYFVEPPWSQVGGNALVVGYQYDGRSWAERFSFEVESVDTTAHTITWIDGSFTGTFREREYTVLRLVDYDHQTADWPKAVFVVHTDEAGKISGAPGFKLV